MDRSDPEYDKWESWHNASYINVEVDSMEECIAKWYVKIDKCQQHIMIGIIGDKTAVNDGLFDDYDYAYWSIDGSAKRGGGWLLPYGKHFGENDEICCILDLKKEISFDKNGDSQGVACTQVHCAEDFKYRLGISILSQNNMFHC